MADWGDYSADYDIPYYGGGGVAPSFLVPGLYPVAINGHPYLLNTDPAAIDSYGDFFREDSLALLRQQADASKEPSEQSVSPENYWRRGAGSWHKGAGQSVVDREDSDNARYLSSKGVDPWTKYQLSLLNDTAAVSGSTTASTNLFMVNAKGAAYWSAGAAIKTSSTLTSTASVTGTPAGTITGMATDGWTVWTAHGADGVYETTDTAATLLFADAMNSVGYAKGRLFTAVGSSLYAPVAGVPGTALFDHPSSGFVWRCYAEGRTCAYAAGDAGSHSEIYRTKVQEDGTGLEAPVVAGVLPPGEIVRSMLGYLGYLIIGTAKGVRFCTTDVNGDLSIGALIPTPSEVFALEGQDRFIWFGWSDYDADSTGLGRMDLTALNDGLAPAYASDLMAPLQGAIQGITTVSGRRVFTVSGHGPYAENLDAKVASGNLVTGQITYGLGDPKVAVYITLKHLPLPVGTKIDVYASFDHSDPPLLIGTSDGAATVTPAQALSVGKKRADEFELTYVLTGSGFFTPTLTRWTLLSYPAPNGTSVYVLPLLLHENLRCNMDVPDTQDTYAEYTYLRTLHAARVVNTIQLGIDNWEGTLEEFTWIPYNLTHSCDFWNGTFVAKIRRLSSP